MAKDFEVPYERLNWLNGRSRKICSFRSTAEIEGSNTLIGQQRAEKAMEFGISMKQKGYNIYIAGNRGSGKTHYALDVLKKAAYNLDVPDDWCYVYNFENKYEPEVLRFPAGLGKMFRQDIEYIVDEVGKKLYNAFNSEEYDRSKNEILGDYHNIKAVLIDELNSIAESKNLQLKVTSTGFAFIPISEGKPLNEEEYDSIDVDDRDAILKNVAEVRTRALEILRKLKSAEKESDDKTKKLDREIGLFVIEGVASGIRRKYSGNENAVKYIENLKHDMLDNIDKFVDDSGRLNNKSEDEALLKYKVNLVVDNSKTYGGPVIYESNPTYSNLMGAVEYESKQGIMVTDFLMIRAGSILKANGGYLILNIEDMMKSNYQVWETLKRALESGILQLEGLRNQLDLIAIAAIKPKPIPIDLKVVLIGSEKVYQLLCEYDEDFSELFKVKVDFDIDMERNEANIQSIVQFISYNCGIYNIRHLEGPAAAAVIEYSSRLAGSSLRLSCQLGKIIELLNEANSYAEISGNKLIGVSDIKKALSEKKKRTNMIQEKVLRQYSDKKIMVSVQGEAVGQINGLSVIEAGDCTFGKPYRITATTYMGKGGIINIEREVLMSGSVHNKSVMIIAGYLGGKYAREIPLSLTAHICFEQLYGFIDGDSASAAELYAILSSLSGIPLKQSIAVTGSLNQMGEIQPVGGINEKIEGFYNVCAVSGLTGEQGVIIPYQNVDDLILDDELLKSIKNNMFHIYAIKDVDEGIILMTGVKPGRKNKDGKFEEGSLNFYIDMRIRDMIRNFNSLDSFKRD